MNRKRLQATAFLACALMLVLSADRSARAQDNKTPYSTMAPLDQYLMADRNAEIALARSAAPEAISRDAKVLVLGRHGYETAVEGKNGFVCVVERAWMNPFDAPEYWNPKVRGPICFNPPAVQSILPFTYKRTEWILAGASKDQVMEKTRELLKKKQVPALEPGAMTYMMSKEAYLTDHGDHNAAHLMFYTPLVGAAAWGANIVTPAVEVHTLYPNTPVLLNPQFNGKPEPINVFMVSTGKWSDGSPASVW